MLECQGHMRLKGQMLNTTGEHAAVPFWLSCSVARQLDARRIMFSSLTLHLCSCLLCLVAGPHVKACEQCFLGCSQPFHSSITAAAYLPQALKQGAVPAAASPKQTIMSLSLLAVKNMSSQLAAAVDGRADIHHSCS
jgi:hypothetical protein